MSELMSLIGRTFVYGIATVGAVGLGAVLLRPVWVDLTARLTREQALAVPTERANELPGVWVAVPAAALIVAFVVLSAGWYLGGSLIARLPFTRPADQQKVADTSRLSAWYVSEAIEPLTPGTRLPIGPDDQSVILTLDDVVFSAASGSLLRLRSTGPAVRLTSEEGQRVRLTNVGPWDATRAQVTGLAAIYTRGRWHLDASEPKAGNPNSDFSAGDDADPLPGYRIVPSSASVTLTRLVDADGPFVRVQATRAAPYVEVTGTEPVSSLNGAPVDIRGRIRTHVARAELTLTLHDVVAANGRAIDKVDHKPSSRSDEWTTLSVHAASVMYPSQSDYFSIGIAPVNALDSFDVRELSVFVGVFPSLGDFLTLPAAVMTDMPAGTP